MLLNQRLIPRGSAQRDDVTVCLEAFAKGNKRLNIPLCAECADQNTHWNSPLVNIRPDRTSTIGYRPDVPALQTLSTIHRTKDHTPVHVITTVCACRLA